jgi:hypothetical protein
MGAPNRHVLDDVAFGREHIDAMPYSLHPHFALFAPFVVKKWSNSTD